MPVSTKYAKYTGLSSGGGGVTSLDGLTGALTLTAGTGISIVDGVSTITISSTSAGDVTIGAFGSTPNANGLSISGSQVLNLQPADATHPGGISVADWNTFNNKQNALTLGNLTDAGTDGITVTNGTGAVIGSGTSIAQHVADSTHNGYLSSTDWSTFNNKQSTLSLAAVGAVPNANAATLTGSALNLQPFSSTFPGVVTASGGGSTNFLRADGSWAVPPGATTGTVTSVSMTVPTFLSISGSPVTTSGTLAVSLSGTALPVANGGTGVTSLGNLTDVGTDGIVVTGGTGAVISNISLAQHVSDSTHNGYLSSTDWSTFNGKQAAGNYITALTGDVTASGPGSVAATLATVNSNVGSFGSATQTSAFTVNAKGLITAASNTAIAIPFSQVSGTVPLNQGGTGQTTKAAAFDALSPMSAGGDLLYGGASGTGTRLPNGTVNQYLASAGTTAAPVWTSFAAPTTQRFTSGSAATYTLPTSPRTPLYIVIEMTGQGGGGGGSSTAAAADGGTGSAGSNSIWATSADVVILQASGGSGGTAGDSAGGAGGTTTLNAGATQLQAFTGARGGAGLEINVTGTNERFAGGTGGANYFGGAGAGGTAGAAGSNAVGGTGGGGGGGGAPANTNNVRSGSGGGAGGYIRAVITSPSASYHYTVGTSAGGGGSAGTSGFAGGNGGDGSILVTEFYQ